MQMIRRRRSAPRCSPSVIASGFGRGCSFLARSLASLAGAAIAQFILGSSTTNTVSAPSEPAHDDDGIEGGLRVEAESCLPRRGCQVDRVGSRTAWPRRETLLPRPETASVAPYTGSLAPCVTAVAALA